MATRRPELSTLPSPRTVGVVTRNGLTRLTLSSRVVYARPAGKVVWTAHAMAESSNVQKIPAVDRPDGVVEVLPDVEAEDRPPRGDLDEPHAEQEGDRRRWRPSVHDALQVVEPTELRGQLGPGSGILPGHDASPARQRAIAFRARTLAGSPSGRRSQPVQFCHKGYRSG